MSWCGFVLFIAERFVYGIISRGEVLCEAAHATDYNYASQSRCHQSEVAVEFWIERGLMFGFVD
jgi:hypothetical protein